jgi:hypothetical protein
VWCPQGENTIADLASRQPLHQNIPALLSTRLQRLCQAAGHIYKDLPILRVQFPAATQGIPDDIDDVLANLDPEEEERGQAL